MNRDVASNFESSTSYYFSDVIGRRINHVTSSNGAFTVIATALKQKTIYTTTTPITTITTLTITTTTTNNDNDLIIRIRKSRR